jgi:hypothetical protein
MQKEVKEIQRKSDELERGKRENVARRTAK